MLLVCHYMILEITFAVIVFLDSLHIHCKYWQYPQKYPCQGQ